MTPIELTDDKQIKLIFQPRKMTILNTQMIEEMLKKKSTLGKGATSTVIKVLNNFTNKGFLCLKILNSELFRKSTNQKAIKNEDDLDDFGVDDDDDNFGEEEKEEEIEIDVDIIKQLYNEYELLLSFDHPNIVKVYGFYFGDKTHNPAILLEYCKYNLEETMKKKITDADIIGFIFEICSAMKYVHKKKIIHRDLKMKNILINSNKHVKICDFGIAKVTDLTTYTSLTKGIGTLAFMAPELFNQNEQYNEKVDVYAFGVVMYFMLTRGMHPNFTGIGEYQKLELPNSINQLSQSIIKKCWSKSPNERPSFKEIKKQIIESEFKLIDGVDAEIPNILNHLGLK